MLILYHHNPENSGFACTSAGRHTDDAGATFSPLVATISVYTIIYVQKKPHHVDEWERIPLNCHIHFLSCFTATRDDSSHCMNGGTGFLNTFCFCQPDFSGRYCESHLNNSCGDVQHGQYVYRNCSLCCCIDGVFECRKHELEGCRKTPGIHLLINYIMFVNLPFYKDPVEVVMWSQRGADIE